MKQTTAQLKANKKYLSTLDEFKVRCEKGAKDKYKAQAAHRGFSLNSYVIALLERDGFMIEMENNQKAKGKD